MKQTTYMHDTSNMLVLLGKIFDRVPNYDPFSFWDSDFNLKQNGYSSLILFHSMATGDIFVCF